MSQKRLGQVSYGDGPALLSFFKSLLESLVLPLCPLLFFLVDEFFDGKLF